MFGRRPRLLWGANAQPISVEVAKPNLTRPGRLFRFHAKFLGDGVNIVQTEVEQCMRSGISLMLGEKESYASPRDRNERRKTWLEAVLPLLAEPESLVPIDSRSGIAHVKDGNDFFVHTTMILAHKYPKPTLYFVMYHDVQS